jgi:hypothetical protein
MKIIYFLFTLLFLSVNCFSVQAQIIPEKKELIFFTVDKKKGIYRSFDEFRNNNPSILYKGEVINTSEPDIVNIEFYEGDDAPCPKNTFIWGFCDGLTVYISEMGKFKKRGTYTRLQHIGRYSYFQKEIYYTNNNQMAYSYASRLRAFAIDANTGEVFSLNREALLHVLSKDEVLMKKYEAGKKTQENIGIYLRLYSTNHPEEIQP